MTFHVNVLCTTPQEEDTEVRRELALREVSEHEAALHHTHTTLRSALVAAHLAISQVRVVVYRSSSC